MGKPANKDLDLALFLASGDEAVLLMVFWTSVR